VKLLQQFKHWLAPLPPVGPAARLFAAPFAPAGGWWRDDPHEQLRQFQSWVFAAVSAIAQEVALQAPQCFQDTGPADHEQNALPLTHPLPRLLANPNPWLTAWELGYLTTVYLELTGNAFWYLVPDARGLPAELWVVPSPWVEVLRDPARFIGGYRITSPGGRPLNLPAESIVHLKYPNPADPYRGLSPLQANALAIDTNAELLKARHQSFSAGAKPGVVLSTEQVLTDRTVERIEDVVKQKFGGRDNWHRPLVLEQGLKASPWTLTPAEMDYANSSRLSRDEIFALFRVPLPVAGIAENTGLGGEIWHGARVMFCEATVQPKLELIAQCLTRDLAKRFGPELAVRYADCSPRAAERRRQAEENDLKLGLRSIEEVRAARGWRGK
jgi:HK97 family phage portal protein